jgi:hypothetical protein
MSQEELFDEKKRYRKSRDTVSARFRSLFLVMSQPLSGKININKSWSSWIQ